MNIIVPLAGPDFVAPTGLVKGMSQLLGQPLLKAVLESRPWHSPVNNYYFIYQDLAECRVFHFENVRRWFPRSEAVFIGGFTQGAALTALIGVSALKSFDEPMVVDLADIYFEATPNCAFNIDRSVHFEAAAATFSSTSNTYSYLAFDDKGAFVEAREKKVISNRASAGVYFFKNSRVYLRAINWLISADQKFLYNDLYYVCPVLNGVAASGGLVSEVEVLNVVDPKLTL